jgi:aspartyl protease family protein
MTGDQTASMLYLVLLGCVLAGYLFLSHRQRVSDALRQAGLWALIFLGVIAVYGLWTDISGSVLPRQSVFAEEGRIEVPLGPDGHYHMTLEVNGTPVRFIVDTGASDMVLSAQDAERVGIDRDNLAFTGVARTANGTVSTAQVWLDEVSLGPITDTGVPALVNGGEMSGSLLGMGYLNRFEEVRFGGGQMTLIR